MITQEIPLTHGLAMSTSFTLEAPQDFSAWDKITVQVITTALVGGASPATLDLKVQKRHPWDNSTAPGWIDISGKNITQLTTGTTFPNFQEIVLTSGTDFSKYMRLVGTIAFTSGSSNAWTTTITLVAQAEN